MNLGFEIEGDVKEFLEEIVADTKGYDVYLGGGYLRDKYVLMKTEGNIFSPKDIDLFFVPKEGEEIHILPIIEKTYINYDKRQDEVPDDMKKRGIYRLRGMYAPSLYTTKEVQFIVYDKPLTIEELAADMDCNVNQVMVCASTYEEYCTEAFLEGHEEKCIELLHTFDEDRMKERLIRMQKRLNSYELRTHLLLEEEDYVEYEKKPERGGSML